MGLGSGSQEAEKLWTLLPNAQPQNVVEFEGREGKA